MRRRKNPTWHQSRRGSVYLGHKTEWTVATGNLPGQFQSTISFTRKADAVAYQKRNGGIIIPPSENRKNPVGSYTVGSHEQIRKVVRDAAASGRSGTILLMSKYRSGLGLYVSIRGRSTFDVRVPGSTGETYTWHTPTAVADYARGYLLKTGGRRNPEEKLPPCPKCGGVVETMPDEDDKAICTKCYQAFRIGRRNPSTSRQARAAGWTKDRNGDWISEVTNTSNGKRFHAKVQREGRRYSWWVQDADKTWGQAMRVASGETGSRDSAMRAADNIIYGIFRANPRRRRNPSLGLPGMPHTWVARDGTHVRGGDLVEFWLGRADLGQRRKVRATVNRMLIFDDHVQVNRGTYGETVNDRNFIRVVRRAAKRR